MSVFERIEWTINNSRWYVGFSGLDLRSDYETTGRELWDRLSAGGLVSDYRELTDIPVGGSFGLATTTFTRLA